MAPEVLVALVGSFIAVALLSGLLVQGALSSVSPQRRRLRELTQPRSPGPVLEAAQLVEQGDLSLSRLATFVPRSPKSMSRIQRRLAMAGYHGANPTIVYSLAELLAPAVLVILALGAFGFNNRTGWILAAFGAVVGFLLPGLVVDRKIALRKKQIRNGLPDVLDLLVVCLEAGSSLDQSIVKASDDLAITYPALAEELRILNTETRAGKPRLEAFKNLAQRTKVEDVRALVAMLVQTDRFGTSVSQTLRTFGKSLRTKRRQLAEERANKVGVKLVFPLVFCLFPAFYVVTLGPAVIQFTRVFFGTVLASGR
jgi:tight adherence protein C